MTHGLARTGILALLLISTMALLVTLSPAAEGGGILPVFTPVVVEEIHPVNTVDDSDDGQCDAAHCSLREAINQANTLLTSPHITFDIPGPGPHVIELCTLLPPLTSPGTRILGYSEPDYDVNSFTPVIVLRPSGDPSCSNPPIGLEIAAGNIQVDRLSIVGFRDSKAPISAGIVVSSGYGTRIMYNYIGIAPSGAAHGNYDGIYLAAEGQMIGGNTISANAVGIRVAAGRQEFIGNLIGTNPQGTASSPALGNGIGIKIKRGADWVTVGGDHPDVANVISGNSTGIEVYSNYNKIQGNLIGTNRSGDAALPNLHGVIVNGEINHIGGSFPGQGNLISGNIITGVFFDGNPRDNGIYGNKIGTDLSGAAPLPNGTGIWAARGSDNRIGSKSSNAGNLIAFNTYHGIVISSSAERYFITNNTITQNGGNGVTVGTTSSSSYFPLRITLDGNSIFDNGGLGVDLNEDGVTANDFGDGDTGPNTLLNFPVFTDATTTHAQGMACSGCSVEIFIADGDPSGHGEGMTFVGEAISLNLHFNAPLDTDLVSACTLITATTTDPSGNSSEFAENFRVKPCFAFSLQAIIRWFIIFPLAFGVLGAVGTGLLGGQRGTFTVGPAATGSAAGIVAGLGLVALASALPFVHIERPAAMEPPDMQPLSASLPPCELMLDPASFYPEDGATLPEGDDPILQWAWSQELPEGQIRWRVDLLGPDGVERSQTTAEDSLPLSAFDAVPEPGGRYAWRVTGERAEPADADFQPFCSPSMWRSFFLGASPPEEPRAPTPTPTPGACVYEALQNSNCRASDYQESDLIAILMQGDIVELLALNPEYTHGVFELPSTEQCWIWLGLMDGPENPLHTCGVPVIDPPMATPTPACQPDLDQDACEASGGTWSSSTMGPPICRCP